MNLGRQLPIPGAILSSLLLSIFLYSLTARSSFPAMDYVTSQPAGFSDRSAKQEKQHESVIVDFVAIIMALFGSDSETGPNQIDLETKSNVLSPVPGEQCQVSEKYPVKVRRWCDLITQYSLKNNLDPDMLAGLIWLESGGNPSAYSHSGAVGLMQVMPRDGLAAEFVCKNGPCFRDRPTINELENPEFNISFGSKMLSGLIQRRGSLRDALKSYGPMDVGYSYADRVISIFHQYED